MAKPEKTVNKPRTKIIGGKKKPLNTKTGSIRILKNGPYLISDSISMAKEIIASDQNGVALKWQPGEKYPEQETYALCRCGHSENKPYCDGSHIKSGFDGTETACRDKYISQAETYSGPDLVLTDVETLCAGGRFCHRAGNTWALTKKSANPKAKKLAIQEAGDCPSGRLVVWNKKTGKAIEPELSPSISVVEDPFRKVSGPLWVKGKVPIEAADGCQYEIRNRVTLCRCGKSKNKPFCDAGHIAAEFKDGDESLG